MAVAFFFQLFLCRWCLIARTRRCPFFFFLFPVGSFLFPLLSLSFFPPLSALPVCLDLGLFLEESLIEKGFVGAIQTGLVDVWRGAANVTNMEGLFEGRELYSQGHLCWDENAR